MTTGGVDDDARKDEHHRPDPGQVSDVLVRHEPGVMVMGGRRHLDEDVAHEGQRHECQTDAYQQGKLVDLAPDVPRDLYH